MKNQVMFEFDYLFGDHMAKVSHQAKLYYVKLMFYANNGFVSNPIEVLDSLGYDKGVLVELINNGDLLKLPDRCEVFITAYFIHNHFKPMSWLSSPFSVYWKGKLYIKKNGVATFTPQDEDLVGSPVPVSSSAPTPMQQVVGEIVRLNSDPPAQPFDWDKTLDEIDSVHK